MTILSPPRRLMVLSLRLRGLDETRRRRIVAYAVAIGGQRLGWCDHRIYGATYAR